MNLNNLFQLQAKLDNRIVKKFGLEGQDLLPKKILALQVELAECAAEWRGFKFWSEDQKPRTWVNTCQNCIDGGMKSCCGCEGKEYYNPLLEEYVDCLHFILSIGLDLGIDTNEEYFDEDTDNFLRCVDTFGELFAWATKLSQKDVLEIGAWESLVFHFYSLGKSLGFTWTEIEQAYLNKNKVNHERQENGY